MGGGRGGRGGGRGRRPYTRRAPSCEGGLRGGAALPTQIPTKDKKFIFIDEVARWRITDPLLFMQTVANEIGAQARLNDIIASATRDIVTGHILQEVVRSSNRLLDEPPMEVVGLLDERALQVQPGLRHGRPDRLPELRDDDLLGFVDHVEGPADQQERGDRDDEQES